MTQYMLSVYMVEGAPVPSGDDIQRMFKQVDTFNAKLQKEGSWVLQVACTRRTPPLSCAFRTVKC